MESCTSASVKRTSGSLAEVEVQRQGACAHCSSSDVCGLFSSKSNLVFEVDNPIGAEVGQVVEIKSVRTLGLKAAAMVYLLPAFFLLSGIVAGSEIFHLPPWGSCLVGFAMMGVAWLIAKAYDKRASQIADYRLSITRILDR